MALPARAPYTLDLPRFPLSALVAHAARAPLGNGREVTLATIVVCRLALGLIGPGVVPVALREQRASAARLWLASVALPSASRIPVARAIDASIVGNEAAAGALRSVLMTASAWLDAASIDEVTTLVQRLLNGGD
jgi:hypothetical protein